MAPTDEAALLVLLRMSDSVHSLSDFILLSEWLELSGYQRTPDAGYCYLSIGFLHKYMDLVKWMLKGLEHVSHTIDGLERAIIYSIAEQIRRDFNVW